MNERFLIERPLPTVTKFYGDNPALVQDFIREIESCWKCTKETDRKLDVLHRNVSAEIRGFLRTQSDAVQQDPEAALAAIVAAYGEQRQPVRLLDELSLQKQKAGESARTFSIRVHELFGTLTTRQKQLGDTPTSERFARDIFIRGLQSQAAVTQLHAKVLDEPAMTFRSAVEHAVQLCGILPTEVSAAAITATTSSDLHDKQMELLSTLISKIDDLARPRPAQHSNTSRQTQCYNCLKYGHIARNCRQRRGQQTGDATSRQHLPATGRQRLPDAARQQLPAAGRPQPPAAAHQQLPAAGHPQPPAAAHQQLSAAAQQAEN